MIFRARGHILDCSRRPYVMGVVNITPDSFSDGGRYNDPAAAVEQARHLCAEGADIIDLGAESSRPGAQMVPADEEIERLLPVVEALAGNTPALLSIDTTKAVVAEACLNAGAHMINDISGFMSDERLPAVVKHFDAGCILMHRRGTAETMQTLTKYNDLFGEIGGELRISIGRAKAAGIADRSIMIDPGIGFAKTVEQNLLIINHLEKFCQLGYPVLLGPSRKSFIGKVLGRVNPAERIWGTAAAVALGVAHGANVVRVHDVAAMRDVVRMAHAIVNQ